LTAGALSIGALVGTGVIDGAVAAPQGDAVFAAAHLSVAPGSDSTKQRPISRSPV
jgi:hypothetical protein